ncbi:MAG: hypothetical protein P8074_18665 [Anaerolineales bacterium]
MSPRGQWMFDPDAGGKKIPEVVKRDIEKRIHAAAKEQFEGKYTRLEIRFRGQFCYMDAYTEPQITENWPPPDWPETKEEYLERMRSTPVHLCRLRYFGDDRWGFAFYTYSHEKYELSVYPSGEFIGTPEEAFLTSAMVYLNE